MLGLFFAAVRMARADELIIIANNSVKAVAISQNEVRDVFLGMRTQWLGRMWFR